MTFSNSSSVMSSSSTRVKPDLSSSGRRPLVSYDNCFKLTEEENKVLEGTFRRLSLSFSDTCKKILADIWDKCVPKDPSPQCGTVEDRVSFPPQISTKLTRKCGVILGVCLSVITILGSVITLFIPVIIMQNRYNTILRRIDNFHLSCTRDELMQWVYNGLIQDLSLQNMLEHIMPVTLIHATSHDRERNLLSVVPTITSDLEKLLPEVVEITRQLSGQTNHHLSRKQIIHFLLCKCIRNIQQQYNLETKSVELSSIILGFEQLTPYIIEQIMLKEIEEASDKNIPGIIKQQLDSFLDLQAKQAWVNTLMHSPVLQQRADAILENIFRPINELTQADHFSEIVEQVFTEVKDYMKPLPDEKSVIPLLNIKEECRTEANREAIEDFDKNMRSALDKCHLEGLGPFLNKLIINHLLKPKIQQISSEMDKVKNITAAIAPVFPDLVKHYLSQYEKVQDVDTQAQLQTTITINHFFSQAAKSWLNFNLTQLTRMIYLMTCKHCIEQGNVTIFVKILKTMGEQSFLASDKSAQDLLTSLESSPKHLLQKTRDQACGTVLYSPIKDVQGVIQCLVKHIDDDNLKNILLCGTP